MKETCLMLLNLPVKRLPISKVGRLSGVLVSLLLTLASLGLTISPPAAAAEPGLFTGEINGAAYKIEFPADWNGILLVYSHGLVSPGAANPAQDASDSVTGAYLLSQGFALAGSAFSQSGWALEQAFSDQVALLDFFKARFGVPKRTIAWGSSLGGIVTGGLMQLYPARFDAGLPLCGTMLGGINYYDLNLDLGFTIKTLLAPSSNLQVTNISDGKANSAQARQIVDAAQKTAQGQARIALAGAFRESKDWYDPATPQPQASDLSARQYNMYRWVRNYGVTSNFENRADIERRAGGNFSSNVGLDYRQLFEYTAQKDLVRALYAQAGLDLDADLAALNNAPRIASVPSAVDYLNRFISFNGKIQGPVLTLHTTDDGFVVSEGESAYAQVVQAAGNSALLQQLYIRRPGHCTFTPAEIITALNNLLYRLDTGQWQDSQDVDRLNREAAGLGAALNTRNKTATPPAFTRYQAPLLPRLGLSLANQPPYLGPETRLPLTFPQTGFSLRGIFLSFWTSNGGLPVFGYPIEDARQTNGQAYQWLERNRLEYHPENAAPYKVLLGLLGSEALKRQGLDWGSLPRLSSAPAGCRYFSETGHTLCGEFLTYWQNHGLEFDNSPAKSYAESLALFGFPITEPKMEQNSSGDTVLTQWFERARLELHPANPQEYRVLLGRIGAELFPDQAVVQPKTGLSG
jgi:hypothetical protein